MKVNDRIDIKAVGRNEALGARILAALLQPSNVFVARFKGVLGFNTGSCPTRGPVGRGFEELGCAEGVGQHDEQLAPVALLPKFQYAVLRCTQLLVRAARS